MSNKRVHLLSQMVTAYDFVHQGPVYYIFGNGTQCLGKEKYSKGLVDKLRNDTSFTATVFAGTNGNRSFECKPGTRVIHLVGNQHICSELTPGSYHSIEFYLFTRWSLRLYYKTVRTVHINGK